MEVIPTKQSHMLPRMVLLTNLHMDTLVHKEHAELQEVPPNQQVLQRSEQQQLPSKQPSKLIQFQFALMPPTGPNIQAEHSTTVQQTSIMQSSESDLMLQDNGSSRTHGELHGDNQDTSLLLLVTLVVF